MLEHGFIRVAAAVPKIRVADCAFNAEQILGLMARAETDGVAVLVFPELCLTGYTCGDLYHQPTLQRAALAALGEVVERGQRCFSGLAIVGLPLMVDDQLCNVAAVVQNGAILGLVPKSYLPNYKEFYDARWFAPGTRLRNQALPLLEHEVPFGTDLLFDASAQLPGLIVGVEICEDLWLPIPPSSWQALAGATVLVNLSASNEVIGKAPYRRQLVVNQSGRCLAGYIYASCGVHESTTDIVFGGHALIAENGVLLAETRRFDRDATLLLQDFDLQRLRNDRQKMNSFGEQQAQGRDKTWRRVPFALPETAPEHLVRSVEAHPFVPRGQEQLRERCEEIFHTQVAGLAKRLEHIGGKSVAIGVSGGLDSTLALLVTCKTFDLCAVPRAGIHGLTMPGFGTTSRTRQNALDLMRHLGVTPQEIDIRGLCLDEMRALGHRPFGLALDHLTVDEFAKKLQQVPKDECQDLIFENIQARMRTSLLMNRGFVVGTGDLSELALGWCTYNADHISMYNPNVSIPKTLVKFLVRWAADHEFSGPAQTTLRDVVATLISPELLPSGADGQIIQETESVIGPYELHDFFLFHFLRYGAPPEKILFLAEHAVFERKYSGAELRQWLKVFLQRFFANQFKRSCLPDGPKVGTISLSPRGDWRMPSDAQATAWLEWTESRRESAPRKSP
jgi:NAD+ synthase (glutamine-hydrolysing)